MPRLILQPASNPDAAEHYDTTIEKSLQLQSLEPRLPPGVANSLRAIYGQRPVRLWGATPGRSNTVNYESIQPNDIALFYQQGRFISSLVVTLKVPGLTQLARELWGTVSEDDPTTWELVYFLDDFRKENISYAAVWDIIHQGPQDMLRGMTVVHPPLSDQVIDRFRLRRPSVTPEYPSGPNDPSTSGTMPKVPAGSAAGLEEQLKQLDVLDQTRTAAVRAEQSILRQFLFAGTDTGVCAICGEQFPTELMVAAHIKRRADCSAEQKKDLNNLMPLCKFGCDDLFERGYILVRNGKVVDGPTPATTGAVKAKVSWLRGKSCSRWNNRSEQYFGWHCGSYVR